MKLLDLAAIRARCDAATRGPWSVSTLTYPNGTTVVESITGVSEPQWSDYGEGEGEWFTDSLVLVETDAGVYGPTMPDAQFIAAARTDVPALLAYVNDLEERALTAEERLEQRTRERDEERAQVERLQAFAVKRERVLDKLRWVSQEARAAVMLGYTGPNHETLRKALATLMEDEP